jgi:CO/xanthine dehydrogenase Mo-binding subunit/aerobic-type carbon monoxide dehydrogenase small subunit (CoxS/CutS family)
VRAARLVVNGVPARVPVTPEASLLDVLRDRLGLTGAKAGCREGECGACAVWVEGRLVNACLYPAARAHGRAVTTIEGLAGHPAACLAPGGLDVLQEAFVQAGAVQCGACIPGMIMAAGALLARSPSPARDEVESWLLGNLCRCTGYTKIVDAVLLAARWRATREVPPRTAGGPGRSAVRLDAEAKVRGTARYADDDAPPGTLDIALVRSPHAHAEILAVDARPALGEPGVLGVLTAADVPGENAHGVILDDQPVFCDRVVRYAGDVVAAVVGEGREAATAGARAVRVHYRPLAAIESVAAARDPAAPPLHGTGNLLAQPVLRRGDAMAALAGAAVVVESRIRTPWIEHAYLEPEAGVAWLEADGTIVLRVSTQTPYLDRDATARVLGVAPARVRVVQAVTGGGFGGKLDLSVQPYLALAVTRFRRPARLVFSREESMLATTKRHPYRVAVRLGATAGGRFTALAADIEGDTGAYASWGPTVILRACVHASGPYAVPDVLARGTLWYTNHAPAGAMRGFSTPQLAVATEGAIDELALRLGVDPIELRLRNALRRGSTTASGQVLEDGVGLVETLEAVRAARARLAREAPLAPPEGPWVAGEGVASMWYGLGNTGLPNPAEVRLELEPDGRIHLFTTAVDIGQGSTTILAQILAGTLALDLDRIRVTAGDTGLAPDSGKTSASRVAFVVGNAVRDAAAALAKTVREEGAGLLGVPPDAVELRQGRVGRADGGGSVGLDTIARALRARQGPWAVRGWFDPRTTALDADGQGAPYQAYAFATQLVELLVNRETGEVRVRRVIAAHDVGRALNPQAAEGQIEGGVVMGLGFALTEAYLPARTLNFSTYLIPTARETPEIVPLLVEVPDPAGPCGAKGVGEPAMIATAPAVLNAIARAAGVRLRRLPATPERVFRAMHEGGQA